MIATPQSAHNSKKELSLLVWAGTATVLALIFAFLALFLWLHPRHQASVISTARLPETVSAPIPVTTPSPTSFDQLQEAAIPGRYRFFENGAELGTMTLNADHTFINKDGTTFKQYRWDLTPEGLFLVWQRSTTRFTIMEGPGTYVAPEPVGKEQRLEKIP